MMMMTMTTRTMARTMTMTMFTSSHLLIFTSSPLGLLPSSSHLLILTSSHLRHILTSSHLLLLPSCPLAFSFFSRKLASASWSLLALASIPGAAQGHEDVKMRRCEDEKMWRWADVKMRRCEDEKMWRWEDVKMRRWETDPHYWKNPALRRSREWKLARRWFGSRNGTSTTGSEHFWKLGCWESARRLGAQHISKSTTC